MRHRTQPRGEAVTITIADDDALAREGLKSLLHADERFAIVGEGADRVELLQLVRTTRPDIVMVDADLLAAAGLGLIRDVQEISPDTKLLLMGIRADPEAIIESLQAGVSGYIEKSSSLDVLADACLQVAEGVQPVLPQMATDLLWYMLEHQGEARRGRQQTSLTRRQQEVLYYMAQGMCNKEIAAILKVSETTVKSHVTGILRKLGVSDRTQAVVKALRDGLVTSDWDNHTAMG